MTQQEIFKLNESECVQGIKSCQVARSIANKYRDTERVMNMEMQIGAFEIQIDMLRSGDIQLLSKE